MQGKEKEKNICSFFFLFCLFYVLLTLYMVCLFMPYLLICALLNILLLTYCRMTQLYYMISRGRLSI